MVLRGSGKLAKDLDKGYTICNKRVKGGKSHRPLKIGAVSVGG